METSITEILGPWDKGYVLDKQIISSTFIDYDDNGRPMFDTERTEVGEALYQLKYKYDFNQVAPLASEIVKLVNDKFDTIDLVIPIPPSKYRAKQPVQEISKIVATKLATTYNEDVLLKTQTTSQMKDIHEKSEKIKLLQSCFEINDKSLGNQLNLLVIDDLYSSGASLEAACSTLKKSSKVKNIFVTVLTRTKS